MMAHFALLKKVLILFYTDLNSGFLNPFPQPGRQRNLASDVFLKQIKHG